MVTKNYPPITLELIPEKVNLNGSAKETLVANYIGVLEAIRALDKAMSLCQPHGRDYQTHYDPDAAIKARKAFSERRVWLAMLESDIQHSAEMVANQ